MGRPRDSRCHARDLRRCSVDCRRHDRYGDHAVDRKPAKGGQRGRGDRPMTFDIGMPMVPELALFVLAVLVLFIGLVRQGDSASSRVVGWFTLAGLLATLGLTFVAREGASLFSGSFVNDGLAIFSKQLFLGSASLSVLGSLTLRPPTF